MEILHFSYSIPKMACIDSFLRVQDVTSLQEDKQYVKLEINMR